MQKPSDRRVPARIPGAATLALSAWLTLTTLAAAAANVEVIATGLDNPRGIALDPAGRILIAEAGGGGVPSAMSGWVSQLRQGKVNRLLSLPSATVLNGEVSGPTSVAFAGGPNHFYVTMGGGPSVPFGFLLDATSRRLTHVADIAGFELANNPDGVQPPDSNPYGVAVTRNGGVLVTDAAANDLLHVADDGTIELVATFPPAPNPLFPTIGGPNVQAVPTSVAIGPDGAWYVSELRGFPFASASHVWRIEPGSRGVQCVIGATTGPCIDWANGLRHVVAIAFGPDGDLYASEFGPGPGAPGLPGSTAPGRVVRVAATTKVVTPILGGLTAPGGIAVDRRGSIFVTHRSTSIGTGEVLRIDP